MLPPSKSVLRSILVKRWRQETDKIRKAGTNAMNQDTSTGHTVACRECRYYAITWDPTFPYGCRAHMFKSKKPPALEVYEASGLQCLLFTAKRPRNLAETKIVQDTTAF